MSSRSSKTATSSKGLPALDIVRKVALAGIAFALLSACDGGSSPEPTSTGASLSRADFVAEVDAICASDRDKLTGLEPPRGLDEAAGFLREVLPVIRDQLNRIRDLGQPPEIESETYLDWFQARDGIVETTAAMIEAAEEGDRDQFQRLAVLQQELDERADEAADSYGFEVCGAGAEDGAAPGG